MRNGEYLYSLFSTLMTERVLRFVCVGIIGACIELGFFSFLLAAGVGIVVANVTAFHVAFGISFVLHFIYTHRYSLSERHFFVCGFAKYAALMYVQLAIGTLFLWFLITKWGCVSEVAKLIQIATVTPLSFMIQKTLIFQKSVA